MMFACLQQYMAVTAPTPLSSPALAAFIRGIERRALVVAEFQSGEVLVAERAVAVAMRAFVPAASQQPMTQWPAHFWTLLTSTPLLRQPAADGSWPYDMAHLAQLPDGERLALLLRIGGGLDEPAAAGVLGVDVDTYCQALATACPRDAQGQPDAQAWRALAESVQQRVRDLSPERQAQLNRLRDSLVVSEALAPERSPAVPVMQAERRPAAGSRAAPRSNLGQWLWLLAGAALLAGVAWAWVGSKGSSGDAASVQAADGQGPGLETGNPVEQENLQDLDLPPASAPAPIEPVADPEQASLLRQADFLAWFAAGGPLPVDESQEQPQAHKPALLAAAGHGRGAL